MDYALRSFGITGNRYFLQTGPSDGQALDLLRKSHFAHSDVLLNCCAVTALETSKSMLWFCPQDEDTLCCLWKMQTSVHWWEVPFISVQGRWTRSHGRSWGPHSYLRRVWSTAWFPSPMEAMTETCFYPTPGNAFAFWEDRFRPLLSPSEKQSFRTAPKICQHSGSRLYP